ncbi:ependymin [Salarias fasciatus]|uniref:ependymin n=1 Tax=Salarias fasciatus TaxID=181472 RepID=UPI001176CF37|nr:ependymin-2-like [Salarias fasciatus]
MYVAVTLFVLMCLTATTRADHHHHPCHAPNMTGHLSVVSLSGETRAYGTFTYESTAKKLRFRSNESHPTNTSIGLDVLMFFEEGVFYEIDSKNQSCEKKALQCSMHPMDIPDDAKFYGALNVGNPSIEGEGLKVSVWIGGLLGKTGSYSTSVTVGCVPLSTMYFIDSSTLLFTALDIDNEIKDPDLLLVPSICQGLPLEETPEGTVHSFYHEFI